MARRNESEATTQTSQHEQAPDSRESMLAQAQASLTNGEKLFDIAHYPALKLGKVESSVQSLNEVGITTEVLSGSDETARRAREVIYTDPDDQTKGYRFATSLVVPVIRPEAYADIDSLAQAIQQWLMAVSSFNEASVWVGAKSFGRKNHYVDGGQMNTSDQPVPAGVLLKSHFEKGIRLVLQGAAASIERPNALAYAKTRGFVPSAKTAKTRATRSMDEV